MIQYPLNKAMTGCTLARVFKEENVIKVWNWIGWNKSKDNFYKCALKPVHNHDFAYLHKW